VGPPGSQTMPKQDASWEMRSSGNLRVTVSDIRVQLVSSKIVPYSASLPQRAHNFSEFRLTPREACPKKQTQLAPIVSIGRTYQPS
jgi:hypothetical protein